MKFLALALLTISINAFAADKPEAFVDSATITPDAQTLIVRVSYCGDAGNFQFDLLPCGQAASTAARCYEVVPKTRYAEACRRIITRTETFDFAALGETPPPANGLIQLRGSRDSLVELRTPRH